MDSVPAWGFDGQSAVRIISNDIAKPMFRFGDAARRRVLGRCFATAG
jgi:hypothetical protein